jgi:hypothetical protein
LLKSCQTVCQGIAFKSPVERRRSFRLHRQDADGFERLGSPIVGKPY